MLERPGGFSLTLHSSSATLRRKRRALCMRHVCAGVIGVTLVFGCVYAASYANDTAWNASLRSSTCEVMARNVTAARCSTKSSTLCYTEVVTVNVVNDAALVGLSIPSGRRTSQSEAWSDVQARFPLAAQLPCFTRATPSPAGAWSLRDTTVSLVIMCVSFALLGLAGCAEIVAELHFCSQSHLVVGSDEHRAYVEMKDRET